MKFIRNRIDSLLDSGDGPSPIEYGVIVTVLVIASLTVISTSRYISHPYLSNVPIHTTTR